MDVHVEPSESGPSLQPEGVEVDAGGGGEGRSELGSDHEPLPVPDLDLIKVKHGPGGINEMHRQMVEDGGLVNDDVRFIPYPRPPSTHKTVILSKLEHDIVVTMHQIGSGSSQASEERLGRLMALWVQLTGREGS